MPNVRCRVSLSHVPLLIPPSRWLTNDTAVPPLLPSSTTKRPAPQSMAAAVEAPPVYTCTRARGSGPQRATRSATRASRTTAEAGTSRSESAMAGNGAEASDAGRTGPRGPLRTRSRRGPGTEAGGPLVPGMVVLAHRRRLLGGPLRGAACPSGGAHGTTVAMRRQAQAPPPTPARGHGPAEHPRRHRLQTRERRRPLLGSGELGRATGGLRV